jgi:8-oxo-dGTP diphosphatase
MCGAPERGIVWARRIERGQVSAGGSEASGERHTARLVTLCFVCNGDEVLLLRHSEASDRFPGQWNGIGGHVEQGECIRAAARRELCEETGLDLAHLSLRGVVHETGLLGHEHVLFVFVGETRERVIRSPEDLELAWHPIDTVESLPLVHDVAVLLVRALAATEPFFATERYEGADPVASVGVDGRTGARV